MPRSNDSSWVSYCRSFLLTLGFVFVAIHCWVWHKQGNGAFEWLTFSGIMFLGIGVLGIILLLIGLLASARTVEWWADVVSRHEASIVVMLITVPAHFLRRWVTRKRGVPRRSTTLLRYVMKAFKIAGGVLAVILVFVLGTFVESYVRSLARKPIPVLLEGALHAKVSAYVQPDFLWAGEAWWIEVKSDAPVSIDLDGKWNAVVPPGTNTIYANHDVNNTTRFSSDRWWMTPSRITVTASRTQPIPSGHAASPYP